MEIQKERKKDLIDLAKDGDNKSIKKIIDRHSGLFTKITEETFKKPYLQGLKEEFKKDKPLIFWTAIQTYDKTKDCKFSSWLGNITRWKGLDKIKSHFRIRKVEKSLESLASKHANKSDDSIDNAIFSVSDENSFNPSTFVENIENIEDFNIILDLIEKIPKKKEKKIVKLRLLGDNSNTWDVIAKEVGYCRQQAMNIFKKHIKQIKTKYQKYV